MALYGVIGDSLSRGPVIQTPPWPELVWGAEVNNLALGGTSAAYWAGQTGWWSEVDPGQQWWVLLGTNDFAQGTDDQYEANMQLIVDQLLALGASQVQVVHTPLRYGSVSETIDIDAANLTYVEQRGIDLAICQRTLGVSCGPDLLDALSYPTHYVSDGTHLSTAGMELVAGLIVPEPGSAALLAVGLLATAAARRFRRGARSLLSRLRAAAAKRLRRRDRPRQLLTVSPRRRGGSEARDQAGAPAPVATAVLQTQRHSRGTGYGQSLVAGTERNAHDDSQISRSPARSPGLVICASAVLRIRPE